MTAYADRIKVTNTVDPSSWGSIFVLTAEKGQHVLDAAKKANHEVIRVYGYNPSPDSDHRFRQCVDFMHYGDTEIRDWLEQYLIKEADTLGVMGMISNRRCVGFPSQEQNAADREVFWNGPEGVWRSYSGSNPHTDHVHVQFNTNKIMSDTRNVTLYVIKPVHEYDANGNVLRTRPVGTKLTGWLDDHHFNDGTYLRCGQKPHRVWYPVDHLSHAKPS